MKADLGHKLGQACNMQVTPVACRPRPDITQTQMIMNKDYLKFLTKYGSSVLYHLSKLVGPCILLYPFTLKGTNSCNDDKVTCLIIQEKLNKNFKPL